MDKFMELSEDSIQQGISQAYTHMNNGAFNRALLTMLEMLIRAVLKVSA